MSSDNVEVVLDQTNIEVTHTGGSTIQISTQTEPQNVEIALAGISGATGPANSLSIGDVTTGAPGTSADADITGTSPSQTLNLIIPRGDTGDTGPTGPTGPANVLTVGTVTQLSPVSTPTIGITGTSPSQTVNFGIPAGARILTGTAAPAGGTGLQGDWYINTTTSDLYEKTAASTWTLRSNIKGATGATGNTGATGPANQLTVDSVTASAPGSTPVVTIGGAAPTQTISFVLPRGDTGPIGPAPNLAIGTVTTVAPGGTATADVTGTNPNYVINLGIPRGDKGEIGAQWITGSAAPTSGIGVEGDFYLVTGLVGLGDVYEKTDATTWTLQGNIRGAAGNGDVNAVNSVLPDVNGNVVLTWGDFTGTIPESALPAQAISDTFTVASEAAMLALTAQRGDYAIRTDEGSTYILTAEPASTLSNWTLFRVNASNITTGTLPMGVIPTGTTGTSVALGNHGHSLTDANITGIIPNAKLPARLGNPEVEVVTDWDNALEPGFYYGSGTALNSPAAYATVGLVTRGANANNITQRLTAQADGNDAEFIRKRSAGVWGAWETTMSKTSTLDARYAQIVNAVMLTGAQTIAGAKTFSSSPIVPTPSAGTDATNKTYVDAGLGGKANTAHNHDTGAITTGTMDIARLPTGTTGTTVALGNHLHTGVYEPVIAAGTTSQYRRGDNTWRDLGSDAVLLTGAQTIAGTKTFSTPITVNAGQGWNAVYGTETINFSRAGANYIGSTTATGTLVFRLTNTAASDVIALTLSQSAGTPTATFGGPVVAGGTGFSGSGANITGVVHTTGAETIAGIKTFSDYLTLNKVPLWTGLPGAFNVSGGSDYLSGQRIWHDRFRFTLPTFETSTDGTTWTAGASTTGALVLDGRGGSTIDITVATPWVRWTWMNQGTAYADITRLLLQWEYSGYSVTADITVETSVDGVAWTTRANETGVNAHYVSTMLPLQNHGDHDCHRVTIKINGTAGQFGRLANLELQSTRIGSSGIGQEAEFPYSWDYSRKIWTQNHLYPGTDSAYNLGDTTLKWANVYATNITATTLSGNGASITSVVHTTGNETIAGVKNFSSQITTSSYIDTDQYVTLNGVDLFAATIINASATGNAPHYGIGQFNYDDGSGVVGTNVSLGGYFGLSFVTNGVHRMRINRDGVIRAESGQLLMANGTSNLINFGAVGVNAPTFNTRSAGTKIVLYSAVAASSADYAIGIEGSTLWQSIPTAVAGSKFRWYGGTLALMDLTGTGALTVNGGITSTIGTFSGAVSTARHVARSDSTSTAAFGGGDPIEVRNDTGYPAITFHKAGVFAPQIRAVSATKMQVVNQAGSAVIDFDVAALAVTNALTVTGQAYLNAGTRKDVFLGTNADDWVVAQEHQQTGNVNNHLLKTWMRRRSAGTDWTTADVVEGIAIDSSYNTPNSSRSWWRRNAQQGLQEWGDAGTLTFGLNSTSLSSYKFHYHQAGTSEKQAVASGTSGTVTLDVGAASVYTLTPTGNVTTLTLTGSPGSGNAVTVTLIVNQGATAYSIATPSGGVFYGAATPTQVANKKCIFTYITYDGGASWHCSAAVQV